MEKSTDLAINQIKKQADNDVESSALDSTEHNPHLTRKETRQIVTPYAFFVSDDLLGTPLAGPFRRGFALLIDLVFIALLTQVSSLVLAAVAAWTFFRAGNRLKTKKRFNGARIFLRLLVALLLFVVAMGIVDEINENDAFDNNQPDVSESNDINVGGIEIVAITAKYLLETKEMKEKITAGDCEPAYDCVETLGEELIQDIIDIGFNKDAIDGVLEGYLSAVSENLNTEQQAELSNHLLNIVATNYKSESLEEPLSTEVKVNKALENKENTKSKGLLNWLEDLVEELGLGFGWAAFYFSIFTAWWKGQTPGKKLMGMKVIKLDNKALNLWESFGRYGGYAAGFATGLTGFLQVFWDPNRQAIQDKISETLVIDLRKPKVHFVKEMTE
ncbi:RDD family protein [uncultured Paraglaciecola sp.]|uniref:RDD family protein n=1 Tax=uncultured Paraglaciecola sp. TaxID=1765024 RepID=UPI0025D84E28|nr:RDD family protein [uncultured Paraglaciecola sp.]